MNKYDISNYVVQSNELITSEWKMDRITLKLFEMAVSAVDVGRKNVSNVVLLNKSDVFQMFQADDKDKYTRFNKHIKKLLNQVVEIKLQNDRLGAIVPITYIEWGSKYDDQRVELRFNELIMPYIVQLKEKFTKYKISNLIKLSSKYSIIIYKLAKMDYWKSSRIVYTIKELRKITDTTNEYQRFEAFERRVLKVAMDEINNGGTDIVISYEKIKVGRRITAIEFKVRDRLSYKDNDYFKPRSI